MGKSTFSKYVIRRALESLQCFPVLVELRRIKKDQELPAFICDDLLGPNNKAACVKKLLEGFRDGGFLFVLDGYDELSEEMRQSVSADISTMSAEHPLCKFLLTSRPDAGLASFAGFVQYGIQPLKPAEAYALLKRYDQGRDKAEGLIEKIKSQPQVKEFLGNPLLVTLL